MKYVKKFNQINEDLIIHADLNEIINKLNDKVSVFLSYLTNSTIYDTDNNINFIYLANDINKFSFVPTKKRYDIATNRGRVFLMLRDID